MNKSVTIDGVEYIRKDECKPKELTFADLKVGEFYSDISINSAGPHLVFMKIADVRNVDNGKLVNAICVKGNTHNYFPTGSRCISQLVAKVKRVTL